MKLDFIILSKDPALDSCVTYLLKKKLDVSGLRGKGVNFDS